MTVETWAESPADKAAVIRLVEMQLVEMQMATGMASVQYRLGKHSHDFVAKRYFGRLVDSILVTILADDTFALHIDSSDAIRARMRAAQIVDKC